MDEVDLEIEFDNAKTIPDAILVIYRTMAYGFRARANVMAKQLKKEAFPSKTDHVHHDPKPMGHEPHAEKAKPILDMIDEACFLTQKINQK